MWMGLVSSRKLLAEGGPSSVDVVVDIRVLVMADALREDDPHH